MLSLFWLALAGCLYSVLMFLGWLLAAVRVRPALEAVELFSGPRLFVGRVGGVPVSVGCIPYGAALRLPDSEEGLETDEPEYEALPASSQALLELLPVLLVLGAAAVVLREGMLGQVLSGLVQIPAGAWAPRTEGVRLVQAWMALPPLVGVAVLQAKLAALNLLPLPSSAVGRLVLARLGRRGAGWVTLAGAFLGLALSASWLFALMLALLGPR